MVAPIEGIVALYFAASLAFNSLMLDRLRNVPITIDRAIKRILIMVPYREILHFFAILGPLAEC